MIIFYKKKFFLLFFLFFGFNVYANENIAYLDIDYVLNNSEVGKKILTNLESINKKNIDNIKLRENSLKEEKIKIKNVENIISKDELAKKIKNFQKEVTIFNKEKKKMLKELDDKRQKDLSDFLSKISPLIEQFMRENSITMLLDKKNIFIADPKYDITEKILKLVNKKIKK
tara:strand:- start:16 stop:531 length:516 start_codon:yes stop_codon:yes gene_type:complete